MAASSDDRVDLTELDVITRYSLAVRTATADRAELVTALRNDLRWLEGGGPAPAAAAPRKAPQRQTSARKSAERKAPERKAPVRKAAAKKTAARRAR